VRAELKRSRGIIHLVTVFAPAMVLAFLVCGADGLVHQVAWILAVQPRMRRDLVEQAYCSSSALASLEVFQRSILFLRGQLVKKRGESIEKAPPRRSLVWE